MGKKRTKAQKDADKKRSGRPPLPKRDKRTVIVRTCLTPVEAHKVERAAKCDGKDVSTYIRDKILRGLD